jgi:hypothetical protein
MFKMDEGIEQFLGLAGDEIQTFNTVARWTSGLYVGGILGLGFMKRYIDNHCNHAPRQEWTRIDKIFLFGGTTATSVFGAVSGYYLGKILIFPLLGGTLMKVLL